MEAFAALRAENIILMPVSAVFIRLDGPVLFELSNKTGSRKEIAFICIGKIGNQQVSAILIFGGKTRGCNLFFDFEIGKHGEIKAVPAENLKFPV